MSVKGKLLFGIIALVLVVGVLGFALKAHAEERRTKEYYEVLEQNESEYIKSVRRFLTENGFNNAGINLTKTFNGEEIDEYKLVVNHHSFEYASTEKLASMEDTMAYGEGFYLDGAVRIEFSY